ncbi:rhamnogalacturonan acetylesterase [Sphingopyxis sp. MWB1]|uniref:rhamnogalacturonan acetylesterase n=1 Tax=Sphingopyxis sp. MWB1 TaxID=1537715 RepID=UPI00051A003D|nr:rhamnogalacturonan acetylesterase [Sphingopyxis sp. MWB1]
MLGSALAGCTAHPDPVSPPAISATPTLFIASDSTASDYAANRYPQSGWGTFIGCALTGVKVDNRAIGGRSTRTFIDEGRWNALRQSLKAGDTVLIQFGHNDASKSKPERFAAPETSYRQNLVSFIADVRAAGATPILLTPVARRSFEGEKAKADFPEYSAIVRELAASLNVELIDLESRSRQLLDQLGREASRAYYLHYPAGTYPAFPKGIEDDTHFSEVGARHIANLVAEGLAQSAAPVARHVSADRRDLMIDTPLGSSQCR